MTEAWNLREVRDYHQGFSVTFDSNVAGVRNWIISQNFNCDIMGGTSLKAVKKGTHVNFVPELAVNFARNPQTGCCTVTVSYWAKVLVGKGIALGILTGGLSTVVGVGTFASHVTEARKFVASLYAFIDGLAGCSSIVVSRTGFGDQPYPQTQPVQQQGQYYQAPPPQNQGAPQYYQGNNAQQNPYQMPYQQYPQSSPYQNQYPQQGNPQQMQYQSQPGPQGQFPPQAQNQQAPNSPQQTPYQQPQQTQYQQPPQQGQYPPQQPPPQGSTQPQPQYSPQPGPNSPQPTQFQQPQPGPGPNSQAPPPQATYQGQPPQYNPQSQDPVVASSLMASAVPPAFNISTASDDELEKKLQFYKEEAWKIEKEIMNRKMNK